MRNGEAVTSNMHFLKLISIKIIKFSRKIDNEFSNQKG